MLGRLYDVNVHSHLVLLNQVGVAVSLYLYNLQGSAVFLHASQLNYDTLELSDQRRCSSHAIMDVRQILHQAKSMQADERLHHCRFI